MSSKQMRKVFSSVLGTLVLVIVFGYAVERIKDGAASNKAEAKQQVEVVKVTRMAATGAYIELSDGGYIAVSRVGSDSINIELSSKSAVMLSTSYSLATSYSDKQSEFLNSGTVPLGNLEFNRRGVALVIESAGRRAGLCMIEVGQGRRTYGMIVDCL